MSGRASFDYDRIRCSAALFTYGKILQPGGMAERLKAHVLKTCLGHTNVGSNPTPSASRFGKLVNRTGEVPEWSNGAAC
jgi:hypothetical protein